MINKKLRSVCRHLAVMGFCPHDVFEQITDDHFFKKGNLLMFEIKSSLPFENDFVLDFIAYIKYSETEQEYFLEKISTSLVNTKSPAQHRSQVFYGLDIPFFSAKEIFNLLQGRAVYKNYTASSENLRFWFQLDFSRTDTLGNYKFVKYGDTYNLDTILSKYPVKELRKQELKTALLLSLKKGNIHPVTFVKETKLEKKFICASPATKSIKIFPLR
ncbi:MAG: hypothetical protein J0H07_32240 [Sphingobacteriales bacterium]|mgnify:CR=1 FL=1|nr:hypothetical protein [Sphingobacteriales bacterium]